MKLPEQLEGLERFTIWFCPECGAQECCEAGPPRWTTNESGVPCHYHRAERGETRGHSFTAESIEAVRLSDVAALPSDQEGKLRRLAMLAPHEIRCRCGCKTGDTFSWQNHAEHCPRHEVGAMIAAAPSPEDGETVRVPPVDRDALPAAQEEALFEFFHEHKAPGHYRSTDGAYVHGVSLAMFVWADQSQTDLLAMAGNEETVQVRISPEGVVTETQVSKENRAA